MKRLESALLFFVLASVSLAARDFTIPFKQYTLKNGMTVILSEDHASPTLAVTICYDVGSRDEQPGRTGFAHFFEHLMYTASENWVPAEVMSHPAPMNGSGYTTNDRTTYQNTLTANLLDRALFYESDRMHLLTFKPDAMENARGVVKEERRVTIDNQPYGKTNEAISDTAYDAFPYKHLVFGSMADLDAASLDEFQAFYKRYYAPNNATLVIVGDFKSDEALVEIRKYFENIPRQPAPPRPDFAEAPQASERRKTVQSELAQTPRIDIVYKIPPGNSPDWYPIAVLCRILGSNESSRLSGRLVRDTNMASGAFVWNSKSRGPGLVNISLNPRPGQDLAAVEKATYEEIAKLRDEPVADWEMETVRIAARREGVTNNEGFVERASNLAAAAVVFGDVNLVNTEQQKLAKVTKADVMRVARKYFAASNRTVVVTLPKAR